MSYKDEIIEYLSGPRDRIEGAILYQKYGTNLRLKQLFISDESQVGREMMFDELRKLAGLSDADFAKMPRRAKKSNRTKSIQLRQDAANVPDTTYKEAPEPVKKMIKFRDKYSFLNSPDCPDVLKILVADMFTAHAEYVAAHARLQELGDSASESAMDDCEKVISNYLENREILDELEYYREHGTILGKARKQQAQDEVEDLTLLSDIDLMKRYNSACVQVTKHKSKMDAGNEKSRSAFERWSTQKQILSFEIARRKKNAE